MHYTTLKHVTQSHTAGTNILKYVSHLTQLFTHHHLQSFKMSIPLKKTSLRAHTVPLCMRDHHLLHTHASTASLFYDNYQLLPPVGSLST